MLCFDFMERYTEAEIVDLDTKHTKQLLNLRNSYYVNTGYCLDWCGDLPECKECRSNIIKKNQGDGEPEYRFAGSHHIDQLSGDIDKHRNDQQQDQ